MNVTNLILLLLSIGLSTTQPIHSIKNLRAHLLPAQNVVLVEWQYNPIDINNVFTVRYRVNSQAEPWKYIRTGEQSAQLPLTDVKNGEQIHVQVQAEKEGDALDDWSQQLVITVNKKISVGGVLVSEDALLPPLDFAAHILGPTSVQLHWTPPQNQKQDIFYLVTIKQVTSESGTVLQNQQIKTSANSFTLGKLISGEKYELTIRSATSQVAASSTAAVVQIVMPKEEDYFEIGNLIISSHFQTPSRGIVNLTWNVPPQMAGRIVSYDVEYSDSQKESWKKVVFHGNGASAVLTDLKSNTDYLLRIKTTLTNNVKTESGQFRFKTPKVESNPIKKVDVIYSHDVNSVKLQWMLESHIDLEKVAGYDVYLSEDKDAPDSAWRIIRLNNKDSSLSVNDLKSSTVYYVRVNVRNADGSIIRAPSIYRFRTIENENGDEPIEGNSLSYRNVGPGEVEIKWTFPTHILDNVVGATILYTNRKDIPPELWEKVNIEDSQNRTIVLRNLREGDRYSVQIIPKMYTGELNFETRQLFEIAIDRNSAYEPPVRSPYSPFRVHPSAARGGKHFQQMVITETEYMRIISCNPDAIQTGCAWDELCITRVDNTEKGWCVSNTLRDSILNS